MKLDEATFNMLAGVSDPPLWEQALQHVLYERVMRRGSETHEERADRALRFRHRDKPLAPCPECGKVPTHRRGWVRIYCSTTCQVKFNRKLEKVKRGVVRPMHCKQCQKPLVQTLTGRVKNFCTERCAKQFKRGKKS